MNEELILKIFAERFKSLVGENQTDINKLTQYLGLKSKATVYRYLNAEMNPKISTVKMIAEFYQVNPVWLMGYNVSKKEKKEPTKTSATVFIYGVIPAGIPIECIEDIIDTEEIDSEMLKGR